MQVTLICLCNPPLPPAGLVIHLFCIWSVRWRGMCFRRRSWRRWGIFCALGFLCRHVTSTHYLWTMCSSVMGCSFVQIQSFFTCTCTLLEYFHVMSSYTSTPLHLGGKYCTLDSAVCLATLVTSYFPDYNSSYPSCPVKTLYRMIMCVDYECSFTGWESTSPS